MNNWCVSKYWRSWSKARRSCILANSGRSAIGRVSEVEDGCRVLSRGRMWLFFHEDGNAELANEALMRAVRWGRREGAQSLSMALVI